MHPHSRDHSGRTIDTLHVILVVMSSAPPHKGYLALASRNHGPKVDMTIDGEAQPMFGLLCLEFIMVRYSKPPSSPSPKDRQDVGIITKW